MLANAVVVIILQHISVWNQHLIHLKVTQCYISILSKKIQHNNIKRFILCKSWASNHCGKTSVW